jgi:hypothetical protein
VVGFGREVSARARIETGIDQGRERREREKGERGPSSSPNALCSRANDAPIRHPIAGPTSQARASRPSARARAIVAGLGAGVGGRGTRGGGYKGKTWLDCPPSPFFWERDTTKGNAPNDVAQLLKVQHVGGRLDVLGGRAGDHAARGLCGMVVRGWRLVMGEGGGESALCSLCSVYLFGRASPRVLSAARAKPARTRPRGCPSGGAEGSDWIHAIEPGCETLAIGQCWRERETGRARAAASRRARKRLALLSLGGRLTALAAALGAAVKARSCIVVVKELGEV